MARQKKEKPQESLEKQLWAAADKLRKNIDARCVLKDRLQRNFSLFHLEHPDFTLLNDKNNLLSNF